MNADLIARLRKWPATYGTQNIAQLTVEAADALEAAQAERERLEQEQVRFAERIDEAFREGRVLDAWNLARAARAALATNEWAGES